MAQVVVAQRMWQRRDVAANWQSKNPVLAAGEIGVQLGATSDETKFKIGDGVTPWNSIGFFEGRLIEIGTGGGYIRWRYVGDENWINLVSLESLRGPQGNAGATGANGLSAYQVAVANGFAGTQAEWLASLKGAKGDPGIQGPPGIPSQRRIQRITDTTSGSVICDWNSYDEIRVTLTANTQINMEGALDGQGCVLLLKQDAVGGRAVTFSNNVRFNNLISTYNATSTPGKSDRIGFVYDDDDGFYDVQAVVDGI
ncbi:tail assembly protein [Xylella phage Sano]|uniref:Tail assembly protein n=1 Tax=Xylella phage Sano TaxID=1415148 RepID=V5Q7F2_9CAUD|nr:tail assembly protein [Xylella phage Sano]AHB12067.1 tail assembly protein [Xylella phage Sano]